MLLPAAPRHMPTGSWGQIWQLHSLRKATISSQPQTLGAREPCERYGKPQAGHGGPQAHRLRVLLPAAPRHVPTGSWGQIWQLHSLRKATISNQPQTLVCAGGGGGDLTTELRDASRVQGWSERRPCTLRAVAASEKRAVVRCSSCGFSVRRRHLALTSSPYRHGEGTRHHGCCC